MPRLPGLVYNVMSFCRIYLLHGVRRSGCICEGCTRLITPGTEIADRGEKHAKNKSKVDVPVRDRKGS